jgi:hypothetical protein
MTMLAMRLDVPRGLLSVVLFAAPAVALAQDRDFLAAAGMTPGIEAPSTVRVGTVAPITVRAPDAKAIVVVELSTGFELTVEVGSDKYARFELPSPSRAGSVLIVIDRDDPRSGAIIAVVP